MTEFSNNPQARDELERLFASVGDPSEIEKRIQREKEAEGLPQGSRRHNRLIAAMRRDGPPTETQIDVKRFFGFGLVAAIAAGALFLGEQSVAHTMAATAAGADYNTTLHGMNPFNIIPSVQRMTGDTITQTQDTIIAGVEKLGAIGTGVVDVIVAALRPWKRPIRRGRFF